MLLDLAWRFLRPALFSLDAERAHRLVLGGLGLAPSLTNPILRGLCGSPEPGLATRIGPLALPSPIGLAAGLDKDGDALTIWPALGFGFVEVGTVTARPQAGNPQPRLFRLVPERALVNRMGFNNRGSAALADLLSGLRDRGHWPAVPVGANIGKSKLTPLDAAVDDYLESVGHLCGVVDYLTVNVSSPNTPGLRDLQAAEPLAHLLEAVVPAAGTCPVLVKLAPDLDDRQLDEAVEIAITAGVTGIIATNTTRTRPGTTGRLGEEGGLSGSPLWPLARDRIGRVLQACNGRVPVVGVGGVSSAARARELLDAGCAAVQIYSALIFEGPGLVARLNRDLARRGVQP